MAPEDLFRAQCLEKGANKLKATELQGKKCIRVARKTKQFIRIYDEIQQLVFFEVFLLNNISFESDTSMKDSCIAGQFQTWSAIGKFFNLRESMQTKQKDALTSFLLLKFLEAKIFQL